MFALNCDITLHADIIYWIKWVIARIAILINCMSHSKRFDFYDITAKGDPEKINYLVPNFEKEIESPFPESHLEEFTDEVVFYGVNSKSECLLVRIAREANNKAEALIYLKLSNGKMYQLSEMSGYQFPFEEKCTVFSCGGLQMHYLAPMRRWRIFFCGMLREVDHNKKISEETVFVKFSFIWIASCDVYDLTLDTNPNGIADAFARANWETPWKPPLHEFAETFNFYAQSGNVFGTVSVDDGPEYEMYLFGEKIRNLGKQHVAGAKFRALLGCTPETGLTVHMVKATVPNILHNFQFGFVVEKYEVMEAIKKTDISIQLHETEERKKHIRASFTTSKKYEISGCTTHSPRLFYNGENRSGYLEIAFIEFEIEDAKGFGFIFVGETYNVPKDVPEKLTRVPFPEIVPFTLPFTNKASHFEAISGGKGSSLGKLTLLSHNEKSFIVPRGIVVTTAAYNEFVTPEITNAVKELENTAYGNTEGDLINVCKKVSDVVVNTQLPDTICQSIIENLKSVFGEEINTYTYAVRSSATGEDTASMSAAGQMDTFLGIKGIEEILHAVKTCWASQFSHMAVEYKRRNGQLLNSPMAVVIQEMAACEVSGVLFTCDPVTNNPSIITITANYGLGETVVSGSVEPDTIKLRRNEDGDLNYDSVIVGAKHQKIILEATGGTSIEDAPENARRGCCVSQENALKLGNIAQKIEQYYRSPRDIEWGIVNDQIYILQSRPVTNIAAENEYELKHELNSHLRGERDYLTIANVGEGMPGAQSPLAMDLWVKRWNLAYCIDFKRKEFTSVVMDNIYYTMGILTFFNHFMLPLAEMMVRYGPPDCSRSKGTQMSFFGRVLNDPELFDHCRNKYPFILKPSFCQIINYFKGLFVYDYGLESMKERLDNYHLNFLKEKTSKDTFAALMNSSSDFELTEDVLYHCACTENSSEWNVYIFEVLTKVKTEVDSDAYADFSRLLTSSSNVESANVPQSMQEVADQIEKDIDVEEFKSMSVEHAEKWLQSTNFRSGKKFREFLKRHGHRCLEEYDIHSVTWGMDSKPLIHLLQTLVGAPKGKHKVGQDDDTKLLSELNTPLGFLSRMILKYIVLPNCRRAVKSREASKSLIMKSNDYYRKGFRHIAKLMVSEGRISDEDLIFFMTIGEIDELLKTRCPGIISRANKRRKLFPTLNKYKFPEIMKGLPQPIMAETECSESYQSVADLTMTGIPVCQGLTKGYARVATTIEEAAHLKPGEILITYCTDIGWSPYFPIISGVVTEIGGLISHGAVVSREYGLPCVVGLRDATKKFQTGDYVLLDGKKGILQRLPKPTP